MTLALMQPYFFPYLGYFDLICQTDLWVVFDTAQYIRRGWMHRNRILHPQAGWQYVSVPISKQPRATPIDRIRIAEDSSWRERIPRQLQHYHKHAPFYADTVALVTRCLQQHNPLLARLNVGILAEICCELGLRFDYVYLSELNLPLGPIHEPGDWALHVAEALGADRYLNPPGGHDLYSAERFEQHGIQLALQSPLQFSYACPPYEFVASLSIIDVLMWNSRDELRARWNRLPDPFDDRGRSGNAATAEPNRAVTRGNGVRYRHAT